MLPITLDDSIRDWVLVPLILIVLFVQIARAYLLKLVQTKNKANIEVLAQKYVSPQQSIPSPDHQSQHMPLCSQSSSQSCSRQIRAT